MGVIKKDNPSKIIELKKRGSAMPYAEVQGKVIRVNTWYEFGESFGSLIPGETYSCPIGTVSVTYPEDSSYSVVFDVTEDSKVRGLSMTEDALNQASGSLQSSPTNSPSYNFV